MNLAAPQLLWLLVPLLPGILVFFWWSWHVRQKLMGQFIPSRLLAGLTVGISPGRRKLRMACLVLAVASLVLTLARPQWGFDWEEARVRGLDIVVAIDTSKSMLAEDIAPNRLERAKLAALDLMQQARSDRLGLVAFAGSAFLQCPLTIDDSAFRQAVQALDVNTIPQGGTAVAEAIETALAAFKEGDNHKVLVIFTDGEDHDSQPLEAAKKAAEAGLRIYTIGVGTPEGEILRIKTAQGQSEFVRDEQGNAVKSHLNEDLLRQIAGATEGGFYLPLRGAKTVDTLYTDALAKLPKSEHDQKLIKQYRERYHWPLALAIAFLLMETFLPERKRESRSRRTSTAAAAAAWALVLSTAALQASPAGALRDYKAGRFEESQKEYEQSLQRKNDDPRLHFNTGAAAYRNHQFDVASKQFDEALNSPDLKLQSSAYYNRGNTLYYLGEQNPDPAKRTEVWKKALQDFESSTKLNPQDPDAKFNYNFVKKRLEELKQQPQNQQNKPDKKDNEDQDKDKDKDKQSQQQNQQDQKDQKDQKQENQQSQQDKSQPGKPDESKPDQKGQQEQQKPQPKPDASGQAKPEPSQSGQTNDQDQAEAQAAEGEMTPQEARQLLDAQKGEEMMMPANPANGNKPVDRSRPIKDW